MGKEADTSPGDKQEASSGYRDAGDDGVRAAECLLWEKAIGRGEEGGESCLSVEEKTFRLTLTRANYMRRGHRSRV